MSLEKNNSLFMNEISVMTFWLSSANYLSFLIHLGKIARSSQRIIGPLGQLNLITGSVDGPSEPGIDDRLWVRLLPETPFCFALSDKVPAKLFGTTAQSVHFLKKEKLRVSI
jgi:hypothetical protein